jgi:hypothetical protein
MVCDRDVAHPRGKGGEIPLACPVVDNDSADRGSCVEFPADVADISTSRSSQNVQNNNFG